MKNLTLAAVLLIAATPATSGAFNLSFVEDLLSDLGVSVDLPEVEVDLPSRAEEAVNSALDRAEMALERVFPSHSDTELIAMLELPLLELENFLPNTTGCDFLADCGPTSLSPIIELEPILYLPSVDVPQIEVTNVDQIVSDALDQAQAEVDNALEQAESILDDISVPDVDQIIEAALGSAESAVEDALGQADGVLDEVQNVIDGIDLGGVSDTVEDALEDASGVVEEILGESFLDDLFSGFSVELPSAAEQAVSSAFSSFQSAGLVTAASTAIPEPASIGLLSFGLVAAGSRRR